MKISVLAKDFNIKSKDIVNILAAAGIERKTSGTIGPEEFSLFFDRLTVENQITNMSDYLAGKADIERPEVIEPKSVPAMEKEERGDLSDRHGRQNRRRGHRLTAEKRFLTPKRRRLKNRRLLTRIRKARLV